MGAAKDFLSQVKAYAIGHLASRRATASLRAAVCSITFDDVPVSAILNGVPILRHYQASATFYVAAGLRSADGFLDESDVNSLITDGFDIGCHTFSHYSLYSGTVQGLVHDAARNRVAFDQVLHLPRARDFSYPFGEVTLSAKLCIGRQYATARSVYSGLNDIGTDLLLLRANPIFSHLMDWDKVRRLLAKTVERRAWVIFYSHGVEPNPDRWSCVPEDLERLLKECRSAGLPIRSVRSVSEELLPEWLYPAPEDTSRERCSGGS